MKAKLKVISYFILEFILSLVILGVVGLFLIKNTLYTPEFMKEQLKKSNYYSELYTSINEEMSKNVIQAGFDESALENIYTQDMLIHTVDNVMDSIYEGKSYKVNTEEVQKNLEANINNYLEKNNIKITDQSALDKFTSNILHIYEDEITLSNMLDKAKNIIVKTDKLVNLALVVSVIVAILLIIAIKLLYKDTTLAIPLITVGVILLFGYLLVTSNVVIDNIYIWDNKVSNLLQQVLLNLLGLIKTYGIIMTIIGCMDAFVLHVIKELQRR